MSKRKQKESSFTDDQGRTWSKGSTYRGLIVLDIDPLMGLIAVHADSGLVHWINPDDDKHEIKHEADSPRPDRDHG